MSREKNKEKGITLIALMITIVIIVILSAITIDLLVEHKIIGIAKEGTENYATGQAEEEREFGEISNFLDSTTEKIIEGNPNNQGEKPNVPEDTSKVEGYVTEGLILHYDAINNTGNGHDSSAKIWKDLSGNNYDGTLEGATWGENYLELAGSGEGVYIGDQIQDLFKGDNTIEISVIFKDTDDRDIIIGNFNKRNNIGYEKISNNGFRIYFNDGAVDKSSDGNTIDIGVKQMLTYTTDKNSKTISLIKNGTNILNMTNSKIGSYNYIWNEVWVGRDTRIDHTCLEGKILSVRVYNRKITDEEIKSNYENDQLRFKDVLDYVE